MKRKALGRGLRSLIPETPKATAPPKVEPLPPTDPGLRQIDIDRIWPNPSQPRRDFDPAALEELAQSMKVEGVLQPVVVRPAKEAGQYELIAGERRWRAAQAAGLLKLPAIVRNVTDDHVLELALIENLQREDLNPIESALAFRTLINEMGLTQQEVGERVGKDRASIANALRLLNLPAPVQEQVKRGEISSGHAKVLLGVGGQDVQSRLAGRVLREGLSVRQLEVIVKRLGKGSETSGLTVVKPSRVDPNVAAAEEALQRALGTRVAIVPGRKGGRLELHYHTEEELARIYQIVLRAARG